MKQYKVTVTITTLVDAETTNEAIKKVREKLEMEWLDVEDIDVEDRENE